MKHSTIQRLNNIVGLVLLVLAPLTFAACDSGSDEEGAFVQVNDDGYTNLNRNMLTDVVAALPREALSQDEMDGLFFMREEEKLAHDVYVALFGMWDRQVFDNISASELTHTEAVLVLLDKYELGDPAASSGAGEFVNTDLQALYETFVETGEGSMLDALRVGAAIEEVDIIDLQNLLDTSVDNQDIELVYQNLMKGSRNHLRAFVRNLSQLGEIYTPQYLDSDVYDDIINDAIERGQWGG